MTQRLYNLNITFYADNSQDGNTFLTGSNKGTVWTLEYGTTFSKEIWNQEVTGSLNGVYSKAISAIDSSKDSWYYLFNNETVWLKIKLAPGYKFPSDIISTIRCVYRKSRDKTYLSTTTPPEIGTGDWIIITTNSIVLTLEDERTLKVTAYPGTEAVVFSAKTVCLYVYSPTLTGLTYEASQSGFHGTSNLIGASYSPAFADSYQDGDNASFTVTPDSGYRFFTPPVVHIGETEIALTDNGDGSYTANFTVTGEFTLDGEAKRAISLTGTLRGVS